MKEITVKIDGKRRIVPRDAYVKAKTKQLREFGCANLTEQGLNHSRGAENEI